MEKAVLSILRSAGEFEAIVRNPFEEKIIAEYLQNPYAPVTFSRPPATFQNLLNQYPLTPSAWDQAAYGPESGAAGKALPG